MYFKNTFFSQSIFLVLPLIVLTSCQGGSITKQYIKRFLPVNPVIVEAGAYNGDDTIDMKRLWPTATIHAFEPIPHLFAKIQARTSSLSNVYCYPYALSDSTGEQLIYANINPNGGHDSSSSLLQPHEHLTIFPGVKFTDTFNVPTITLDQWAINNNILHVDFLWLDMQGYEPKMLMASPNILKTVKVIYSEVNLSELYKGCILYPEFKAWLEQQGFKMVKESIQNAYKYGDALFVREK